MIPLIPILLIGGATWVGIGKTQRQQLIQKIIPPKSPESKPETDGQTLKSPVKLLNSWLDSFSHFDQSYQDFVQSRLDPKIIGETRYQQMLELSGGVQRNPSRQEKQINRRLLLGSGALGLLSLGYLTGVSFTPIILAVAFFNFIPLMTECWRIASEERRLSLLHLLAFYFGYMWFSGYYLIGTLGAILFNLNRKILLLSQMVTRSSLTHLLGQQPPKVWVLIDGVEVEIPFEKLQPGDVLILQAGQPVPIDGTILQGSATVDQHRLTGESQPVEKLTGDTLLASTLILSGHLQVRVEKTGEETIAAKIGAILNRTVEYQESTMADQYRHLEYTRWPMLAGGGLGWFIGGPTTAVALLGCNFLSNLIPLSLITLLNGLKASAEHGVLIKDGRVLEQLPQITTIVFDKTGTLTLAQPQVETIHCTMNYTETEVLTLAAAAEQRQSHPIAQAILGEAINRQLELPVIENANYQLGLGLTVILNKQLVQIGSERFLTDENILLPDRLCKAQMVAHDQGNALVFVAVDGRVIGAIELTATLRPETQEMIDWFKQRGLSLYILSGDQEAPTRRLATELGMDGYFANTLPEQKAERVKELQVQGHKVCFIGDGINDAIALRQAEVSISLRGATTVATDAAQIVLMNDHLKQLTWLWELAQGFENSITTNTSRARQFSLAAAMGVIVLPFKFWIVETMWGSQIITGVQIASRSLLEDNKD